MTDNTVRSAIGAALDYPLSEEAFALVDLIEANVRADDPAPESTRHEVATELTDTLIEVASILEIANLWAVLRADGVGADLYGDTDASTGERIRLDLFVVIEPAVFAALTAYAEEVPTAFELACCRSSIGPVCQHRS